MSNVIDTEACPGLSLTTLGLTCADRSRVAAVWRKSWNQMCGIPAFSSTKPKLRTRFRANSGPPAELRRQGRTLATPTQHSIALPPGARDAAGAPRLCLQWQDAPAAPQPDGPVSRAVRSH